MRRVPSTGRGLGRDYERGPLTYSLEFTEQQGRLVRGTRTSERYTEKVVCATDYDNESIRCTDEDGMLDGKLVNTNEITYHYHHVSPEESVVAVGVMTRKP